MYSLMKTGAPIKLLPGAHDTDISVETLALPRAIAAQPSLNRSQMDSLNSAASIYPLDRYILSKEMGYQPPDVGPSLYSNEFRANVGHCRRSGGFTHQHACNGTNGCGRPPAPRNCGDRHAYPTDGRGDAKPRSSDHCRGVARIRLHQH